ncbi:hypothetical protein HanRHA438_Chr06g0259061 [Helianthus annuus]|uniref:DUF3741-associated sequence motif protein n=2 Tax=Helianthus annuus TaxID=4232 RepID=A0A9K3IR58_HELAN|nr:uncharacterized protein LOC110884482 [Helianthus annuus]XP_021987891.1 uncharacterized protein LOC110884482 [Helianthus annuus]KAF5801583.1 hypothetical protein HanXRQr2_Chr06g0249741 [Helianthus annuus]KAJ0911058.1 hypothetical protein HanRHA438_Chr06g0259061 [Helianthus annuus]
MSRNQNERIRNLERPVSGCLGRMVNVFDLNTSVGGNRLLTEKPHYEGNSVSRSESDVSRSCLADKVMVSEFGKPPSNRKPKGTPIKMLMAQEMSKEEVPKKGPPSLVAKLMGLDDLPQRDQLSSASCRSNVRGSRSRTHSGSLDGDVHQCKDVPEICKQSCKTYGGSPQKGSKYKESKNEKDMALIREKFMEAKRLSMDEKLRQSKQFQDALEVLSSNKDLFLEFLQEPDSLFSQHHNLQSLPPRPDSKRITILKPSKLVDGHTLPCSGTEYRKQTNETVWDRFSGPPNQPTRIVVLKPDFGRPLETRTVSSSPSLKTSNDDGFYGDLEDSEPKERTPSIPESSTGHRRDETLLSSVFSNGYIGDESSFSKSEVYYAAGNLSDSEVMSPTSRHSWEYINRFGSPYSSSSFSRASCSPESSVCREAKKRLSERWAMMSLNGGVQEQRHVRRNSSTLGEMLALSDLKKSVESEEKRKNSIDLNKNKGNDADSSPKNFVRSKSVPVSSTEFLKGKIDDTKDLTSEKSQKSSLFKGNVSRLFFSGSRKSGKQKSQKSDDDFHQSSRNIGDDGSQCVSGIVIKDLPEGSGNANENPDQPSPVSVLESQFVDDDHKSGYSSTAKLNKIGIDPNKYNLIDKSPPIGSISRTLSCDCSAVGAVTPVPGKTSTKQPLSPEEEEQECFMYVQTLLSAAGISGGVQSDSVIARWHSPESPLDPSLRDKYMNLSDKEPHSKQRHRRSFQKLVFDCVNEALTLSSGTCKHVGKVPMERVWGQMKEWISGDGRCVWDEDGGGDEDEDGSLAVEMVARKEVTGEVWMEHLKLSIEDIKKEIEVKLVEQLVDEFVVELMTGRVILAYTP